MILLNEPNTKKTNLNLFKKSLNTNWISTSGNSIKQFENSIKKFTQSKYAIALNSGTSSLHLALKVLGVNEKCEVMVPSITFVATVNSIIYNLAEPIFFDVDKFHNIKLNDVKEFIEKNTYYKNGNCINKNTKKIIKVLIIVHMWGNVCDFSSIRRYCKQRNIKILEDASESLGSYFVINKKKIHTGTLGDIGCLSFNGNKIITTGSGGAILTKNSKYYKKINYLSSQAKDDAERFVHNEVGYNYKMSNINAVLGIEQFKKLKFFLRNKKKIYHHYLKFLKKKGKNLNPIPERHINNHWLNIIKISNPEKVHKKLKKLKIQTRFIWYPNHLQKKFKNYQKFKIYNSLNIVKNSLCLPSGSALKFKEIKRIIEKI